MVCVFGIALSFACKKDEETTPDPISIPANCQDTTQYNYTDDIQSILITHCSDNGCHNAASNRSGLNVHSYQSVIQTINKSNSNFLRRIKREGGVNPMPPNNSSQAPLNADQVSKIACWIEQGLKEN